LDLWISSRALLGIFYPLLVQSTFVFGEECDRTSSTLMFVMDSGEFRRAAHSAVDESMAMCILILL